MSVFLRSVSYLLAASAILTAGCSDNDDHLDAGARLGYAVTPLLSDQAGVAPHQDPALVNAWGLALDTQQFWIANNGTGQVLAVAPDGSPSKFAPPLSTTAAPPGITGVVVNNTTTFLIGGNGAGGGGGGGGGGSGSGGGSGGGGGGGAPAPALLLVASETGQIFGMNPSVVATPQVVVDRSSVGAVYKGLAIVTASDGTVRLLAADFHNARIDVFDTSFNLVTTVVLVDPNLRPGLAPFNIVAIGANVYVTYAIQDASATDDVPGVGNGRIDVFDVNGNFIKTLLDGGNLNAPWGVAEAPSNFGPASGDLIVGNFGDGTLLAINQDNGNNFPLLTVNGNPVVIDGLWGIQFGNGSGVGSSNVLYFASGPANESHGLFGRITVATTVPPS